jgi:hypothetical protein
VFLIVEYIQYNHLKFIYILLFKIALNPINHYGHTNEIFNVITDRNINPVKINVDKNKIISSLSEQNQSFYISFKINKYCFLTILLLAMILGIFMVLLIVKISIPNKVHKKMNDDSILEEQRKQNKTSQSNTSKINYLFKILKNNYSIVLDDPLIKAGEQFGDTDGIYFDDSSPSDFTCSHYFNGLITRTDKDGLESYQFLYHSPHDNQPQIQSQFHGNEDFLQRYEYEFDKDEKIIKVEGHFVNKIILYPNGTKITKLLITGIQFISSQDHRNPLYDGQSNKSFSESFDGYTLGYVTGRSDQYIGQLQFFWYRI